VNADTRRGAGDPDIAGDGPALRALDNASLQDLRGRNLALPVDGVAPERLIDSFREPRGAGTRLHRAVDIMAPRRTPVRAVEAGTVARLDRSAAGGISVYQLDAAERYCYFYAHLERYAEGLAEGQSVKRGEVIAYVGTTGNAPPNTPHLHFAIHEASANGCWGGRAIDPYPLWR
jgi:murein DD-endopeptidase MepM/ murein hydrolase activator NlpD